VPRPFAPADALCAWGVPRGPFLVLPLLGPSTLRDAGAAAAAGAALSQAIGPDAWLAWSAGDALHAYAELHPELERIEAQSLDPYAVLRSAHLQRRAVACPGDRPAD
jgi:phospholipid-binding lipoprotein MlaA